MAEFELKSSQFRREREDSWRALEHLLDVVESRGAGALDPESIRRLPTLYRSAASSLSVARSISLDKSLLDYLENLVGRAYLSMYSPKRTVGDAAASFLLERLPATVRRYGGYLAASVLIMVLGTLSGYLLTRSDQDRFYYAIVPAELAQGRTPASPTEELREVLYPPPKKVWAGTLHLFASQLFSHNSRMAILCFALGFAIGAPTVFLLFYNGMILGAMAALYHARGLGVDFWAWVMPHGVTELGAICLCGAAGLALGGAVLFPGEHTRLDNLYRRGREVALIVIGAVGMLFVAALIEGMFRQVVHDRVLRWSLAAATLVVWVLYFGFVGSLDDRDR